MVTYNLNSKLIIVTICERQRNMDVTSHKRTTSMEKNCSKIGKVVTSKLKRENSSEEVELPENRTSCSTNSSTSTGSSPECFGCHKVIKERFLLQAVDHLWHEDCLKCACCDCRLGEVGSTLFTKANLILCKRDYLRYEFTHIAVIPDYYDTLLFLILPLSPSQLFSTRSG